jgi:lipoteichoic acid synthase
MADVFTTYMFKSKVDFVKYQYVKLIGINLGCAFVCMFLASIPYFLLVRKYMLVSEILIILIAFVYIAANLGLNGYYATSKVSLGADLFAFSVEDLIKIVKQSVDLSFSSIAGVSAVPLLLFVFLYLFRFYSGPIRVIFIPFFLSFIYTVMSPVVDSKPINNFTYFITDLNNLSTAKNKVLNKNEFTGAREFPLLFNSSEIQNNLGPYFNLGSEKPHIFYIIMEGMGRDFMGPNAEFPGFTPFLDSLAGKSLFWNNFVSNAGRSFGAVPSIIGSVPFGETGFNELAELPDHHSMVKILKENNYVTHYWEGGDANFDNKLGYITKEGVENIVDMSTYGKEYTLTKSNDRGFSWGYPDHEIYKYVLKNLKPVNYPRLDILLTISNHEPFFIPNQAYYEKKALDLSKKLNLDDEKLDVIKESPGVFGTLIYTDESIKSFFNTFKNHPHYKNSIFIITGDHRLIPIRHRNDICRFHVPLIIHSPLIKQPASFNTIASHADIMPSVIGLLRDKYSIKLPKKVPFIGRGLLTGAKIEESKNTIPLMLIKGPFKDMIVENTFISRGNTFVIKENMNLSSDYSSDIKRKLNYAFSEFDKINTYVTKNNKIIPDSLKLGLSIVDKMAPEEKSRLKALIGKKSKTDVFNMARELAFTGNRKDALLLCDYLLSKSPNFFDTRLLKGRVLAWSRRYNEAEEEFLLVKTRNPTYNDSYRALITMYYWQGKKEKARAVYKDAKVAFPDDAKFFKEMDLTMRKIK